MYYGIGHNIDVNDLTQIIYILLFSNSVWHDCLFAYSVVLPQQSLDNASCFAGTIFPATT
jgi:hypothetical protein